jgi:alkaline phosphatase D
LDFSCRENDGDGDKKSKKDRNWRKITTPPVIQCIYLGFLIFFLLLFTGSIVWITQSKYRDLEDLKIQVKGQLSHESVSFLVRNPDRSSVAFQYKTVSASKWASSRAYSLTDSNDYLASVTAMDLLPETSYQYRFVYDGGKEETNIGVFTTRPTPGPDSTYAFNFTFGSCIYSNPQTKEPLNGINQIITQGGIDFNLMLGDFIYHEHPFPLHNDVDFYRYQYRTVYNRREIAQLFGSNPSYFMFDDHEIRNNWDQSIADPYPDAIEAWQNYAGSLNPGNFNVSGQLHTSHYFNFDMGCASFFVSDTRTFRAPNSMEDGPEKVMLGDAQLQDLFSWLIEKNNSAIKFITSGVPFSDWAPSIDTWQTRQYEKNQIINFILDNRINGVVFLTGDRHWAGVFQIRKGIYEFTISPWDAFPGQVGNVDASDSQEQRLWSEGNNRFFGLVKVNPNSDNILEVSIKPLDQDPVIFTLTREDLAI